MSVEIRQDILIQKSEQVGRSLNNLGNFKDALFASQRAEAGSTDLADIKFSVVVATPSGLRTIEKTLPQSYHPAKGLPNLLKNAQTAKRTDEVVDRLEDRALRLSTVSNAQGDEAWSKQELVQANAQFSSIKGLAEEGYIAPEQLSLYQGSIDRLETSLARASETVDTNIAKLPGHYYQEPIRIERVKVVEVSTRVPAEPEEDTAEVKDEILVVNNSAEFGDCSISFTRSEIDLILYLQDADGVVARAVISDDLYGDPDFRRTGVVSGLESLSAKLEFLLKRNAIQTVLGRNGGFYLDRVSVLHEEFNSEEPHIEELAEVAQEKTEQGLLSTDHTASLATALLAHRTLLASAELDVDGPLLRRLVRDSVPDDDLEVLKSLSPQELNQYLNGLRVEGFNRAIEIITDPEYQRGEQGGEFAPTDTDRLLEILDVISQTEVKLGEKQVNLFDVLTDTPVIFEQVKDPQDNTRILSINYKDPVYFAPEVPEEEEQPADETDRQKLLGIERMRGAQRLREDLSRILEILNLDVGDLLYLSQISGITRTGHEHIDSVLKEKKWIKPDDEMSQYPKYGRSKVVAIIYLSKPNNRQNLRNRHIDELMEIVEEVSSTYDQKKNPPVSD